MTAQATIWMTICVLGCLAQMRNIYRIWQNHSILLSTGRNGKEKNSLWQQFKNELSLLLLFATLLPAPLIDISSQGFIFMCFFSIGSLAYVCFSRWQFNDLMQSLIRETTNPHEIPKVILAMEAFKEKITQLEVQLQETNGSQNFEELMALQLRIKELETQKANCWLCSENIKELG